MSPKFHEGSHHIDTGGARTVFSYDPECEEGQRQFLLQVDKCNASFTHWESTVKRISPAGSGSETIVPGCERLGKSFNALPVKTALIWN